MDTTTITSDDAVTKTAALLQKAALLGASVTHILFRSLEFLPDGAIVDLDDPYVAACETADDCLKAVRGLVEQFDLGALPVEATPYVMDLTDLAR